MKFCFGDIVVVEKRLIGVVVKCWCGNHSSLKQPVYEVYIREYNLIKEYQESEIERYMVRHKFLNDEELYCQENALNGR